MKIKSVKAYWVYIPIPSEKQHTSDFGRTTSFDATLVRIDTECGITGWGEAKAQVGSMAANQGLTAMINEEFAPLLVGEDPRDIRGCGRHCTTGAALITRSGKAESSRF